ALAPSSTLLLAARTLQGVGAAIISPASLAIITTSFAEGGERNRALGVWGAMAGLGGTSGVLLGGVLTQSFGWPAIFLINVPIGVAVVLGSRGLVPEGRGKAEDRPFDLLGAGIVTLGMTPLPYCTVTTDLLRWGAAGTFE